MIIRIKLIWALILGIGPYLQLTVTRVVKHHHDELIAAQVVCFAFRFVYLVFEIFFCFSLLDFSPR